MGQKHWLDPLARRLLEATGQLPPSLQRDAPATTAAATPQVERDLLELKLKQQPGHRLRNLEEVRLAAELGWRLDVNRATAADWLRLPGIRADQVDLLMRLQAGGVQLSGPEDLQRVLEQPEAAIAGWLPLLQFNWYGDSSSPPAPPQLDLNKASESQLRPLGLSDERRSRLLRERARQPFQDLADLQQRLQLPAAVIESWIGKVRFSQGQAGPSLPLATPER
jgi:hypothetical protein